MAEVEFRLDCGNPRDVECCSSGFGEWAQGTERRVFAGAVAGAETGCAKQIAASFVLQRRKIDKVLSFVLFDHNLTHF